MDAPLPNGANQSEESPKTIIHEIPITKPERSNANCDGEGDHARSPTWDTESQTFGPATKTAATGIAG
ncbi:hypothetical protein PABG_03904 [Paracoccidioides brasiliensis Pb03]|nr:hypothetical protein PABG_03904 [Paracoccidioides brasiliensis Pb03]